MADHQAGTGNAAQIEFWNSAATRAWADQYARMDRAVAALTKKLLDLAARHKATAGAGPGCIAALGGNPFDQARVIILDVPDSRAHGPAGHLV